MNESKRLTVPVCDIFLCINDGLNYAKTPKVEFKCKVKGNNTQFKKMKRNLPRKSGRFVKIEPAENKIKVKDESESENEISDAKGFIKKESEDEDSFKENEDSEVNDYEEMIRKNKEEKMAFLKSLKMDEVKEEFKDAVKVFKPTPKSYTKQSVKRKCKEPTEVLPRRKSSRLAKVDINLSEDALFARAVKEAKEEVMQEGTFKLKPKNLRHVYPLDAKHIYSTAQALPNIVEELPVIYSFEEAINVRDDLTDFVANFDFSLKEDKNFITDYASHFKSMKIKKESNIAKVVPSRITSLALHPSVDKVMIVAGSKNGHLGFWNVTSDANPILFLPHKYGITHLNINPYDPLQVISSSYDGTLRCGDMEKQLFNQIYDVSNETSCTYFDFISGSTLLVSQRNGNVSVIDVRDGSLKSEKKHPCHDYSVKTVHVHPVNKNLFLTADAKGTVKLWDLRKLQKNSLIDFAHHKRSISSAFFSPATGKHILTTSLDDTLCIFDSSNVEKEILHQRTIKHNNFTGRWLSPFKATWLPNSDELFVVGSMNYPRSIQIFNTSGNNVYNFTDEELNSVTSMNSFHPSLKILAGGNSSGKVFVFADSELSI